MTNEEIRLNRYCKHCRDYDKGCSWLCRRMICNEADAYEMALDEKDQQFKEYLEKIKSKYDKDYSTSITSEDDYVVGIAYGRVEAINEIINEFFGE